MNYQEPAATSRTSGTPIELDPQRPPLGTGAIPPRKLAYLNMGLFCQLRDLGTSRERICQAMNLSHAEYCYLCEIR